MATAVDKREQYRYPTPSNHWTRSVLLNNSRRRWGRQNSDPVIPSSHRDDDPVVLSVTGGTTSRTRIPINNLSSSRSQHLPGAVLTSVAPGRP